MQLRQALQLLRYLGPSWLGYRAVYSRQMRRGVFRTRLPIQSWAEQPLANVLQLERSRDAEQYFQHRQQDAPNFFFTPQQLASADKSLLAWDTQQANPAEQCENLEQGMLRFFSHEDMVVGYPPDWQRNYATGQSAASDAHWSAIDDFDAGDIKCVWEPSRFSVVFALVRAYARKGDDRYAEVFWQLIESWRSANPPQQGVNWKCGQEVGLRVLAWCFGLHGFLHSPATTSRRVAELAQMIAVSGQRIEVNLRYALSQRNNHGISEAAALWTIGSLFPEFARSTAWERTGRRLLEQQARELIYEDGAFSQHSMNYHRVILHNYVWVMRLAELHGRPFSQDLYQRIELAGQFLYQLQDRSSGRLPNYGHNDGALVLPFNNCDYSDYRPVVQATQYLTKRTRCYEPGRWDEDLVWLFGDKALESAEEAEPQADFAAAAGGYYALRTPASFVMTRIPRFRHRPAQADALHIDLWWRGQNIALDAGTYSYNAPPPWNNSLGDTQYHNTVAVDDQDQMARAGRFLWLPWLRGKLKCRKTSATGTWQYLEGQHDGYLRLDDRVQHRRGILRLGEEHWLIIDRLTAKQKHTYRLHWLLADLPFKYSDGQQRLDLQATAGKYRLRWWATSKTNASVVRADPESPRGWQSRYYHNREPAISLQLAAHAQVVDFYTLFGPDDCKLQLDAPKLQIEAANWLAAVNITNHAAAGSPLVESVSLQGSMEG